jgi:hypothetical protein
MAYYWLTPPSRAVFIISVFLALLALLVRYAHVTIPVVSTHTFETLLVAFLLYLRAISSRDFRQSGALASASCQKVTEPPCTSL